MDLFVISLKLLSLLLVVFSQYLFNYLNYESNNCSNGYFRIRGMKSCHPFLDCSDFNDMSPIRLLKHGGLKSIYLYKWNDNYLIVSELKLQKHVNIFMNNINNLRQISPNPFVIQLIGWCEDLLFTEYHPNGDATLLPTILSKNITQYNDISLRFQFCIDYVKIIDFLHNSPIGVRVMCDSDSLQKTLSQYLVTNQLSLILNDLDDLTQVIDNQAIKCRHWPQDSKFVAPEQLWNSSHKYDRKADIWKIPDVCEWFLGFGSNNSEFESIRAHIQDIHNQCKSIDPKKRPTAQQILQIYSKVIKH